MKLHLPAWVRHYWETYPLGSMIVISIITITVIGVTTSAVLSRYQPAPQAATDTPQRADAALPEVPEDLSESEDETAADDPAPTDSDPTTPASPTPSSSTKPTDSSTGPRKDPTTLYSGDTLNGGTYENVRFTNGLEIANGAGEVTLKNCVIDGSLSIRSNNLVTIEYCDINGWFGHRTNNTDQDKQLLTVRHSKFVGPVDNDAVRFGNTVKWGDNSTYQNVLIEDSIFHSPFSSTDPSAHFDLMQFGGGNNYTFNRVALSFIKGSPAGVGVAYINNDTMNGNVVFNNLWVEGGPVTYTFRGPMTINTCLVESTTAYYGYKGGSVDATLKGCLNEKGVAL